jgi:hypothetical protein
MCYLKKKKKKNTNTDVTNAFKIELKNLSTRMDESDEEKKKLLDTLNEEREKNELEKKKIAKANSRS